MLFQHNCSTHTENRNRNKIHPTTLMTSSQFIRNLIAMLFRMVKLHWSLRYPFLYNCYTRPVRTSLIAATVAGGGYYIYNERQANAQANFTKLGFHIDVLNSDLEKMVKISSDPSHFGFEINVGKGRIRRTTKLKLKDDF